MAAKTGAVRIEQLESSLKQGLASVYLLSGDEPLLVIEARDAIRSAAAAAGHAERLLLLIDKEADWHDAENEAASLGLFATRRVLDVRVSRSIDANAEQALLSMVGHLSTDDVLIISCGYLDRRAQGKAWFKKLLQVGVHVPIWPVTAAELPRWLERRAKGLGIRLTGAARDYLADLVEGNLLSAAQQLDLLALLNNSQEWDVPKLTQAIEETARYDAFALFDTACAGDAKRLLHMLDGLRMEGENVLAVAGAFTGQLRRAIDVVVRCESGTRYDDAAKQAGLFGRDRLTAWRRLTERGQSATLRELLADFVAVDQQVKGVRRGDPWDSLRMLALRLSGKAPLLAQLDLAAYERRVP